MKHFITFGDENFDHQKNLTHDLHYWDIDTVHNFPMEREIIRSFKRLKIIEV